MNNPMNRRSFLGRTLAVAGGWLFVACGGRLVTTPTPMPTTAPLATSMPASSAQVPVPSCVVRPEQTEGPYFVDDMLDRSDIRSDPGDGSVKEGVPLELEFHVSRLDGSSCVALTGATVDVWHCDDQGVYSGVADPRFDTSGQKFLRGFQVTDDNGVARFTTIYPGWYQGRTVHIHFKIRTNPGSQSGYEFTSQLYFDDAVTDGVYTLPPYSVRGPRNTRNDGDGIYRNGGSQLTLQPVGDNNGYTATFDIGLQVG
jgi:protocatechuate 3,4-dioxygenase beta subunit